MEYERTVQQRLYVVLPTYRTRHLPVSEFRNLISEKARLLRAHSQILRASLRLPRNLVFVPPDDNDLSLSRLQHASHIAAPWLQDVPPGNEGFLAKEEVEDLTRLVSSGACLRALARENDLVRKAGRLRTP